MLEVSAFVIQQTLLITFQETAQFEGQSDTYLLQPNIFTVERLRVMYQG